MQAAQCAQIGYTCDYCCKRAARSCNEVKECMKGHRKLHKQISEQSTSYIGKRHVLRVCSDCYGKGICRSNQESINLRVGGNDQRVTSAESFHTGSTEPFPGVDFTKLREAVFQNDDYVKMLQAIGVDKRNSHRRTPIVRNLAYMYGH